jgi:hypothetical protein
MNRSFIHLIPSTEAWEGLDIDIFDIYLRLFLTGWLMLLNMDNGTLVINLYTCSIKPNSGDFCQTVLESRSGANVPRVKHNCNRTVWCMKVPIQLMLRSEHERKGDLLHSW